MLDKLPGDVAAQLPTIRDEWLAVGLSTEPANRAAAVAGVMVTYDTASIPRPRFVVWLDSPYAGAVGQAYLAAILRGYSGMGEQVGDQVEVQVRDQVWAQVRDQVWDQVWHQVRAQVVDQVRAQVEAQVREQVRAQVGDQVWAQVWHQVGEKLHARPIGNPAWGQHDSGWLGFYDVFRRCGIPACKRLDGLAAVARNAGWWWPLAGGVVLTDRPYRIARDDQHRLHSADGMALEYRDGWGIYAWHGLRVPAEIITANPDAWSIETIMDCENQEHRRAMIERMGAERWAAKLRAHATPVQRDDAGALYRLDRAGRDPLVFVLVDNATPNPDGSRKQYALRCHHELRPMRRFKDGRVTFGDPQEERAINAVASTFGLRGTEYLLTAQS